MKRGGPATALHLPRTDRTVRLRDLTVADLAALRRAFDHADPSVLRARFGGSAPRFEALARRVRALDGRGSHAVAAFSPEGEIVGVAEYVVTDDAGSADVAVVVARAWQHEGVATALLGRLGAHALRQGITRATALVSGSNTQVLELVRDMPAPHSIRYDHGAGELSVDLAAAAGRVPVSAAGEE